MLWELCNVSFALIANIAFEFAAQNFFLSCEACFFYFMKCFVEGENDYPEICHILKTPINHPTHP